MVVKSLAASLVVVLAAGCSSGSNDDERSSRSSPSPSPTSTYVPQAKAPIQPASWIATDVEGGDVFASGDSVLIGTEDAVVSVDPRKERVRWRADVGGYGVVGAFGSVWASDGADGVIRRLDPQTGKVTAKVRSGQFPIGVAATADGVWVAEHHSGSVARIDPRTNKIADRVKVGPEGANGPFQLAVADGKLYVDIYSANTVAEVDTQSREVLRTFVMPEGFVACGPLRVIGDVLWVTGCLEVEKVARIDLATRKITISDGLGGWAGGSLVRGDTLWYSMESTPPDFARTGGLMVGVNRTNARKIATLRTDTTGYGSVEAFGSWWLTTKGGLARYRPADLEAVQ